MKNTLGLSVKITAWDDINTLPDELKSEKEFSIMEVLGISCLVISVKNSDFQLSTFQKQSRLIQQFCPLTQVICFDRINSYQRKCLIENNQAFIVPDNQIYLPFVGMVLQERFKAASLAGTVLTAMAQYILLFFIFDTTQDYHSKLEISQKLDINLMNVTRGVQELEELSLVETRKKGRSSMVSLVHSKQETLENCRDYLRNPVQRIEYVKPLPWMNELPLAKEARVIEKKEFLERADQLEMVDPNWAKQDEYVKLLVWRYDSTRVTNDKTLDPISLALSSMGDDDKAMEMIIKTL